MALISRGYPTRATSKDLLITLFNNLMDEYPAFKSYIPKLSETDIRKVLEKLNMKVKTQAVISIVMGRYELVKKY